MTQVPSPLITQHSINAAAASQLIDHVEADASARGVAVSSAVVDMAGHLVAFRRMDGAYPGSIEGRPQ
jgi:glc operon protein GlcG